MLALVVVVLLLLIMDILLCSFLLFYFNRIRLLILEEGCIYTKHPILEYQINSTTI